MLKVAATATSAQPIKYKLPKAAGSGSDDDVGVSAFINFFCVRLCVCVCVARFLLVSFFGNDADVDGDVDAGDANEPPFSEIVAALAGVACGCVYASVYVCASVCAVMMPTPRQSKKCCQAATQAERNVARRIS